MTPEDRTICWLEGAALAQAAPQPGLAPGPATLQALAGERRMRRAGTGQDFWQFRPLETGEPVERVDWRRSGRSDALYVRTHEHLAPGRVLFWVDGSASMDYSSDPARKTKAQAALTLAAALILVARARGERVGLVGGARTDAPARVFEALGREGVPATVTPARGVTPVLFGDFLTLPDLPPGGGLLVRVIDPAEAAFPFEGTLELIDPEAPDAPRLLDDAAALRSAYLERWAAHGTALDVRAAAGGWTVVSARTDAPLAAALTACIAALEPRA